MFDFEKPRIELDSKSRDGSYARFIIEPLLRGFGATLGNSFRRVLISGLPGSAVSNIKIDGIMHEFSSIPGVKEDVTEIILNIKSLVVRDLSKNAYPKSANLNVSGEKTVRAKHIECGSDIEIINPDLIIANLSGSSEVKLNINMTITSGRGYVSAEKNKSGEHAIGSIPIDSIYTPVLRANYTVEDTRVGSVTDFDRLILEIWTNGAITPSQALSDGSDMISDYLTFLTSELGVMEFSPKTIVAPMDMAHEEMLQLPIDALRLSARSFNCLKRANINIINDLAILSEHEIMSIKNMGEKSMDEIRSRMADFGIPIYSEGEV